MKKLLAAAAAVFAVGLSPATARAQKALVYCPVTIDSIGCGRIVTALQSKFPDGVYRGYDGTNGTLDLKAVDLQHYGVFVVPSLADDDDRQPYAVLRSVADRLHSAINGRVAVYSGAPDQGSANRTDKDALIQNLATWAATGHARTTGLVGLVAFLDLSADAPSRYSWVKKISLADVMADAQTQSINEVSAAGPGSDALSAGGRAVSFSNMASYGLHIGGKAASRTQVGALGGSSGGQLSVLVTYSNADARPQGKSTGTTAGHGATGAAFDVTGTGTSSGPTLTTDKPDYSPGDTVLFTGTGWAPNDTVTITVHEDPEFQNPDRSVTAVADAQGNLTDHDFVVAPTDQGVVMTATGVGNPSGLVAQMTFTDGNGAVSGFVRSTAPGNPPIPGATVACTSGCNPIPPMTTDATGHYAFIGGNHLTFSHDTATVTLTASAPGFTSSSVKVFLDGTANQDFQLAPAGPTKLAFPNPAVTAVVNQCFAVSIQTQDATGTATNVLTSTVVNLATDNGSTGTGAFYTTSACSSPMTSITINTGSSAGSFFYEATSRGSGTHTLTVSATGLTSANQGETINKADEAALSITSPSSGTFGDKLPIVTTGGSGTGALSYSAGASNACAIVTTPGPDLNKLQITSGTGTCSITATKAADNDFNSVTSAAQTVTVAKAAPVFSNLASQTITFGAATTTFTGKLASGALVPTGNVAVTVGTTPPVTQQAPLAADGSFSSAFNTATIPASTTPYTMTYAFTADNNFSAASDATTSLTVNKANQTIAFGTLANKTFGDADFSVSATATSGLAVTFTAGATDQCTVNATGTTVHLTGAGSCTIKADQAGNGNYNAAPQVSQTFTIAKATPVVVATGGTFQYDGLSHAGSGTATGVGGANLTPVTLSYTGTGATTYGPTATPPTNAGTYCVTATYAADANYQTATSTPADLIIKPKPLTITADDKEKTYDATPFSPFTASYSGLIAADADANQQPKAGVLSSPVTFGGTAAGAVNAGTYTITPQGAVAPNYAISFANGTLKIDQATATINAAGFSGPYDGQPHPGTCSATGVNNEVVPTTPSFTPGPSAPLNAGNYTLACAVSGQQNYKDASVTKYITITKVALTVKADNQGKTYDGHAFSPFTSTISGFVNSETSALVSGNVTYAGTAASAVNAGTYVITPVVTGLSATNYTFTPADGSLVIGQAPLTITAKDRQKTYGDVVTFAGTEFTPSGLVNNETVASVTLTSTGAPGTAPVGGYSIMASGATGGTFNPLNYAIVYAPGTLTVKAKALYVKANSQSRVYGATNPALTFTVTGFVNGETQSIVMGMPMIATTAVQNSPVGPYPITISAGTLSAPNYTFSTADGATFTNGQLTVTQAGTTTSSSGQTLTEGTTSISLSAAVSPVSPSTLTVGEGSVSFLLTVPGFSMPLSAAVSNGTASTSYSSGSPIPPGSYMESISYTDASPANYTGSSTSASIGITNVPPSITAINSSGDPVQINTPTTISGTFTDPGLGDGAYSVTITVGTLGAFTCSTTTPSAGCSINAPTSTGPGTFSLTQSFGTASVNTITVGVSDAFGGSDLKSTTTFFVIFDPNGGFVTGGGWINSPAGACLLTAACQGATGKANFGFVSKYQKGANVPDGNTQFQFHDGNLDFESTAYQWLVISGAKAQYKGTGTINGAGSYGFILTAVDGGQLGGGQPDRFRIKITDASGNVVYDNQINTMDEAGLTTSGTLLGGGSIQVHSK